MQRNQAKEFSDDALFQYIFPFLKEKKENKNQTLFGGLRNLFSNSDDINLSNVHIIKAKLKRHFPYLYFNNDKANDPNLFQLFKDTFVKYYKTLTPVEKALFTYVKEDDVESLRQLFRENELNNSVWYLPDKKRVLAQYVMNSNSQALKNFYYQSICQSYQDGKLKDGAELTLFDHALMSNQPLDTIVKVIEELTDKMQSTINNDTVVQAISFGRIDVIDYLHSRNPDAIKKIITDFDKTSVTPLLFAVETGRLNMVEYLVNTIGVNVDQTNKDNMTPLLLAINERKLDIAEHLLIHGANVNFVTKNGTTPLFHAIILGDYAFAKRLLEEYNANVHQLCKGHSLLCMAISGQKLDMTKLLLEKGADVNFQMPDHENNTALHLAAEMGNRDIIACLLEHGADISLQDQRGKTALDCRAIGMANRPARFVVREVLEEHPEFNMQCASFKPH